MSSSGSSSSGRNTLRVLGLCAVAAVLGVGGWIWGTRSHGAISSGPTETLSAEAEFRAIAATLFTSPGGLMDRTGSEALRTKIESASSDVNQQAVLRLQRVEALLREAKTREAVDEAEATFKFLQPYKSFLDRDSLPHMIRGVAYLRLAEVENCINRHNDECCVFPLKGGGVHSEKGPAEQAAASFLNWVRIKPDDLGARWLLNVCHMAMGTYPESVPKEYLIPETGPNSSSDFPRFREVAKSCGIDRLNHAGGVVADDIDGDGLVDFVLSSNCPDSPLAFYRNNGDGTFTDRAKDAGLAGQLGGLNLVGTDYDNDGDIDLHVLRGAWLLDEGCIRKSLLRNDGTGKFTDVTRESGMAAPAYPTQCGVWFDYDNDGDLDVFVGNESRVDPVLQGPGNQADYPSNLFRNDGNGRFTDVARQAGVTNDRYCKGATAGDYDNDGWVDLFVSNIGLERLYHNNGDGTFTDVAPKLGVTEPAKRSFAPWFFDLDNDGDLDIYVSGYDAEIEDIAAWQLGKPFKASPPRLYRNKGDGTFEDVTRSYELWRPMAPMGANFGDVDNDGWLDLFLTVGNPKYEALMPDVMLKNVGGRHFVDVTVAGGFGNLQKGHGVAFVDIDHDGDQDIFNETGGFYQGDVFFNQLYENPGNKNRSISLKLIGTKSNRLAYGARIKVTVRTATGERTLHRAVGSVSSFGGSPSRQEIGLGEATEILGIEIWWPASKIRQNVTGVELDGFYEVTEGVDAAKKLTPKRFKLGGA